MDKVPEFDFSEIQNEEDDSVAFVDFNLLESARQELEDEKKTKIDVERRKPQSSLEPIKEHNDELKNYNKPAEYKPRLNDHHVHEHSQKECDHPGIRPVFDCLYCAKTNIVVDKLIHKNLVNKYKEPETPSLELSMKSKNFNYNMITTTLAHQLQSTAVSGFHPQSQSIQKAVAECKFYSMSNSMAKIKFEKQNTFDGKCLINKNLDPKL